MKGQERIPNVSKKIPHTGDLPFEDKLSGDSDGSKNLKKEEKKLPYTPPDDDAQPHDKDYWGKGNRYR